MADEHQPDKQQDPQNEQVVTVPPKAKSTGTKTLLIVVGVLILIFVVLPIILFTLFAIWLGSGDNAAKLTEKAIESTTGSNVDIDTKNGGFSVKSDSGDELSFGGAQDYSEDFPAEIPKYPGGTVVSNLKTTQDTETNWVTMVDTTDQTEVVMAYFDKQFVGWEQTSELNFSDTINKNYTQGAIDAAITVTKTNSGSSITYAITQKK